jgi:DNA repair exonuclease SbcCD ATPase subunit
VRTRAAVFNIKQTAKTLMFLKEQGIDSYDELTERAAAASSDFRALTDEIKAAESRLKEISELQKYIGQYGKTRDVYAQYRASGWSADFFEAHRAAITLHKAAKDVFNENGYKKLPSINSLKQEYAALDANKRKMYARYHAEKENVRALQTAKQNADRIVGATPQTKTRDDRRVNPTRNSRDR